MANNEQQRVHNRDRRVFVKLCAFIALLLAAITLVFGSALAFLFSAQVVGILNLVSRLALLVAIAFPAYEFVRGKKKAWKIIYWVALAVYILATFFGVLVSFDVIGKK